MLADCQALECCLALYASVSLALHCVDTSRPASSDVHEAVRFVCVFSQVRVGGQYVVRVRGQGEGGWGAWSPRATVKIANP